MFPDKWLSLFVDNTNRAFRSNVPALTHYEFVKFLGILHGMKAHPKGDMMDNWSTDDTGFFPAPALGQRHGMSRYPFHVVKEHLCFWEEPKTPAEVNNRWHPVRELIRAWNEHMGQVFSPGWKICVDESMWAWLGREGRHPDELPHAQKVKRKPRGVGLEVKNAACVFSHIIFLMEIVDNPLQGSPEGGARKCRKRGSQGVESDVAASNHEVFHACHPFSKHPAFEGKLDQKRCSTKSCTIVVKHFCRGCSGVDLHNVKCYCLPSTRRQCYIAHIERDM